MEETSRAGFAFKPETVICKIEGRIETWLRGLVDSSLRVLGVDLIKFAVFLHGNAASNKKRWGPFLLIYHSLEKDVHGAVSDEIAAVEALDAGNSHFTTHAPQVERE